MTARKQSKGSKSAQTQHMKEAAAAKAEKARNAAKTDAAKAAKAKAADGIAEAKAAIAAAQEAILDAAEVVEESAVEVAEEHALRERINEETSGSRVNVAEESPEKDAKQVDVGEHFTCSLPQDDAKRAQASRASTSASGNGSEDASAEGGAVTYAEFADLPPVLIVAAEAAPLAKTGGLADVVGALPKYLKALGVDARIIMPFHRSIKDRYASEATHLFDYLAAPQWEDRFVGIDKLELDGTVYYFVDNEHYFGGPIYTGNNFEGQQYAFFAQAVCDAIPNLDFDPGIIHCNDWHTALVPFKLKARCAREGKWPPATLLTIHNLAFQGTFGDDLQAIAIGPDERAYAWDLGCWNMMKAGIDTADRVSTVSPTYAQEITTPEFGEGLENDLRSVRDQGRLWGILNGIDTDTWNPATDAFLVKNYSQGDMAGKAECKRALLEELGLQVDMDAPLIAMVGRLTPQKGIGIAAHVIGTLVHEGAMFVVLGSGDAGLEWQMREAENRYKGRVCSYIGYNNDLSHRIYAASDFFLMPSAFEPCGISQMIAMRYGSLPIVHETGGLKDTVQPYNQFTGEGCGFSFSRFDGDDALGACRKALTAFGDKKAMKQLVCNAMSRDFGFDRCARTYAELYRSMVS